MHNQQKLTHIEQENGLKPHFGPFLALIGPFLGQQIFFQHLDSHYVLDIFILNHNMQNRQKLMQISQEKGLSPHFGPFLALFGPNFGQSKIFSRERALSLLFPYDALTSCQKAKKSLEPFLRKVCTNY